MPNFYSVSFSFTEPVEATATVGADSPDHAVQQLRDYYAHVRDLAIHEVTLLEMPEEEAPIPPRGTPNLRLVN